jgi:hypothetical protein
LSFDDVAQSEKKHILAFFEGGGEIACGVLEVLKVFQQPFCVIDRWHILVTNYGGATGNMKNRRPTK